jgi:two-component system response regulator HydG
VGAPGLFRVASGGTLFLDEIGELPLGVQAKLLRALQNREVRPLGAPRPVPVDLRVICATHRDLAAMVAAGGFRQDLYYRLNVVRLPLPPLRERSEDVARLAQHFLEQHRHAHSQVRGFTSEALQALAEYDWPGNVRELENTVESALALAAGEQLDVGDLRVPSHAAAPPGPAARAASVVPLSLAAYESAALQRALDECGGDASAAARRLGIGRSTFYRKLAVHGITVPRRNGTASVVQAESQR